MKTFISLLLFIISVPAFAITWQENADIKTIFENAKVAGTFVLYDVANDSYTGVNQKRAHARFLPASTFKIPNTLIGLQTKAVASVGDIFPWDKQPYWNKAWEKDMNLREAMKVSSVPVYQALARRIGKDNMQCYVSLFHYGNELIGSKIDLFWLRSPLKISAIEQTRFLAELAQGALPVDAVHQEAVRDITLQEKGNNWALHAKTGWVTASNPDIGWWVGWIIKDGQIYAFALNMPILNESELPKRIELGKACLKVLGLIP